MTLEFQNEDLKSNNEMILGLKFNGDSCFDSFSDSEFIPESICPTSFALNLIDITFDLFTRFVFDGDMLSMISSKKYEEEYSEYTNHFLEVTFIQEN